jgi:hypothetical protein
MPEEPRSPDDRRGLPPSLMFTDASGVSWAVWELTPGPLPPKLRRLLGGDSPPGGALLFASEANEWRALVPAPHGWTSFGDAQLETCLVRARRVDD